MAISETLNQFFWVQKEMLGSAGISTGSGTLVQDTAVTRHVFIADNNYQVIAVNERHSVIGSTTAMLVKATGSTPLGSGTNLLASTVDLTAAVDVARSGVLIASTALQTLAAGDALGIRWTNTGNLAPVGLFQVTLQRI